MVREVVETVAEAEANPHLTFERAATLSRSTENIVTAIQGLVVHLRVQSADADFVEALEQMLGTLRTADLMAGRLVIQASSILQVA